MRKNRRRGLLAVLLAASTLASAVLAPTAAAAPPSVTTDETVYANLDYYGNVTDVRVVKACNLNGNESFTDYGSYERVSNMSNHAQPALTEEGVTWSFAGLENVDSRFYFECTPKENQIVLPWSFDVGYKLNGVPKRAEELAGASGLVEIDIQALPNPAASAYYRNNMILVCGMLVDTADAYSFSAPGAQMQTIGSKRAALYMATPGQEITFTYQIGADSFENVGAILAMVPATLSQLDEIHNIRDAKERLEDAAKAIDRSLDDLLDTLDDTRGSVGSLRKGVGELDQAREEIHSSMEGIYGATDGLQESLDGFRQSLQELNGVADDTEIDLFKLDDDLQQTAHDLGMMKRRFREINGSLQRILLDLKGLQPSMTLSGRSEALLEGLDAASYGLEGSADYLVSRDTLPLPDGASQLDYMDDLQAALAQLSGMLGSLDPQDIQSLVGRLQQIQAQLAALQAQLGQLPGTLSKVFAELTEMTNSVAKLLDTTDDMLEDVIDVVWDAENTSDSVTKLFDSLKAMMKSLDPLLESSHTFVGTVEDTLKTCGQSLNRGASQTLKGLESLLDQTTRGLDKIDALRDNKQIVKDTIEEEWDRLDEDLGLLDIDTSAERVSFTSRKNPEPESLQIILRTQEISIDDQEANVDLEPAAQNEGVLNRIKNIFVTIWNKLKALFD